jgi:uncharacterized membrane protein YqjE
MNEFSSESTKTVSANSFADALQGLSQGLSSLVKGHLALARVELTEDLKKTAKETSTQLAGIPLLLVGYLLLFIALGALLALAMPVWVAFLICSLVNIGVGAALVAWGMRQVKKSRIQLTATKTELRRDREWFGHWNRFPQWGHQSSSQTTTTRH